MMPSVSEFLGEFVDDGVQEKRLTLNGSFCDFEESDKMIWILNIETPPEERNRGQAKTLIMEIKNKGKRIEWGEFLEMGKTYIKKYDIENQKGGQT
jgi:hypothetical protein